MSVTCIVRYKESCKKLIVNGEKKAGDLRTALLTSPVFKDLVDNMLIQVKDNALNEFFDVDDTTVVVNGDMIRLVENPFLEVFAECHPIEIISDPEMPDSSPATVSGPVHHELTREPSGYISADFPVNVRHEISSTEEGKVSGALRAMIVKQIVSQLCVNTMYPGIHYLRAAQDLVKRYPQLKDKSRTHCASWHASIKNRARNIRKRMPAGVTDVDTARAKSKAQRQNQRAGLPGNQLRVPMNGVRIAVPQAAGYGPGEDQATIEGQMEFMKKEMKKTVWDQRKVHDAMNRTQKARRTWINGANFSVSTVTDHYPALTRVQEIRQEFRRLTGRDAEEGLGGFLEKKTETLYSLLLSKKTSRRKARQIYESSKELPEEERSTALANSALVLLPCLLREKSSTFLKELEPGTKYIYPCIVYTGEDALTSSVYTVTVEDLSVDVASLRQAFSLWMCLFWAFNIRYTAEVKNTLTVLEYAIGVSHTKMGTVALQVWSSM